MKTLEECVVTAMDGSDKELFPFIPYILQDLWEIGADPNVIIKLVKKYFTGHANLHILDLGCGKGAVSIKLAKSLHCNCHGIDAIPQFIETAIQKANECEVGQRCKFETGDIRRLYLNISTEPEENNLLENKITGTTMVIRRKLQNKIHLPYKALF